MSETHHLSSATSAAVTCDIMNATLIVCRLNDQLCLQLVVLSCYKTNAIVAPRFVYTVNHKKT